MSIMQSKIDADYEAVPFTFEEYDSMKKLFKSAFGISLKKNVFLKRFDTMALGGEVIGFIAKHRSTGAPAAYYGVFPVKIQMKEKQILAAQSGDTMTHADHRKKGLFVWLAKLTFSKCRENGIELIFGMPNQNSYHGLTNSLKFQQVDRIVTHDLKLIVKTIPWPKLFQKLKLFNFYIRLVKKAISGMIQEDYKEFIPPDSMGLPTIVRDKNYLNNKAEEDKVFMKIKSVVVWIKFTDVLWIGDFDDYRKVDEKVLKKLKRLCFFLGYNTIRFNINAGIPQPEFLNYFKMQSDEASCFLYINKTYDGQNVFFTAADFDTW